MEYELSTSEIDKHKHLPEIEQWRAHRTLPTTEFFAGWTLRYEKLVWFMSPRPYLAAGEFQSRADQRQEEEELCHQALNKWTPDLSDIERIKDESDRQWKILHIKYPAVSVGDRCAYSSWLTEMIQDVYNTYLRYGWGSESFDKQACRVKLLEMERVFGKEERRLMDLNDPDADIFD